VAADSQLGQAAGPEAVTEVSDTADLSMPVRCRMCRMLGRQRTSVRVSWPRLAVRTLPRQCAPLSWVLRKAS